ncbi:MAG TPA: indole-3-glycerol-phosphate synthase [Thermoanaerobaculia bacterium]|nr:indole-3-glycerol-phosphate synthase [Thermoanaerobaculia bacterium]
MTPRDLPHRDPRVADVLLEIVRRRRERFAGESPPPAAAPLDLPASGERHEPLSAPENPFLAALAAARAAGRPAVIAEVKMGSPRLGPLAGRVDPLAQARLYGAAGATALSVVVEPDFFHGSYELLAACRRASGLPAVAKDFLVDVRQLEAARASGADAVLLIAALHDAAGLARWAARARALGLAPLIETHDDADLDKLGAGAGWELVGVNNRDLRTFEVDLERSGRLARRLPAGALRVAESGIGSGADVARLAAAGFDAFLVGESLLLADDPAALLAELAAARAESP